MRDYSALANAAAEKRAADIDDRAGAIVLKLDEHLDTLTGYSRLDFLAKLDALMDNPGSLVATAIDTNGRPAMALGGGTSDTSSTPPIPTVPGDPLAQRFNALETPVATAAVQFGEKLASGAITPLHLLALTHIIDGDPNWEIVDDGTGQPMLKAVQVAQRAADAAKRALRDLATKVEAVANRGVLVMQSVRKLQDDLGPKGVNAPGYTGALGPNPAHRDDVEQQLNDLAQAAKTAKRS